MTQRLPVKTVNVSSDQSKVDEAIQALMNDGYFVVKIDRSTDSVVTITAKDKSPTLHPGLELEE